jgi:hypothetical protein
MSEIGAKVEAEMTINGKAIPYASPQSDLKADIRNEASSNSTYISAISKK